MADVLDLRDVAQDAKEYEKIVRGQTENEILAGILDDLAKLSRMDGDLIQEGIYLTRASNLRYCHHRMYFDYYQKHGIMDYQWTFRCRDRFCPLCAKDVSNTREYKYNKVLDSVYEKYSLFHVTFTLPNCTGNAPAAILPEKYRGLSRLSTDIPQMQNRFKLMTRYLSGNAGIRGVDMAQYGYAGAIRSLEITYNNIPVYHPHYHVILALRKDVELPGENYNAFSWDIYTRKVTPFSDFEILLQKIWFLILNNRRVLKQSIEDLPQGYSVRLRGLERDEYHQAFKYVIKSEKSATMDANIFQDLDAALFGRRAVQCYGIFHGLKLADEEIDDENDALYDGLVVQMREIEAPQRVGESPSEVRDNIMKKKRIYISRRRVRAFVRKMGLEGELPFIVAEPERVRQFYQMMFDMPAGAPLAAFDGSRNVKRKNGGADFKGLHRGDAR